VLGIPPFSWRAATSNRRQTAKVYTQAAPIPAAAAVPEVEAPVAKGKIKVLDKPGLEKKIKLPLQRS
jgi:hypothetical protein